MPDDTSEPKAADAPPRVLSPAKRRAFTLVTVLIGVTLALAVGEIGVRIHRARNDLPTPRSFIENPHGTGSYRLKPHLDAVTRVGGKEITLRTNAFGMPWREVTRRKPEGVRRIAIVGDSFAQGLWAASPEKGLAGVFASMVEPEGYEVLNFGVSGYGLEDIELQIREEVLGFDPDYIILVFYTGNDFIDTYLGLQRYRVVDGKLLNDESVVLAKVPPPYNGAHHPARKRKGSWQRWTKWLRRHSDLYRALRGLKRRRSEPLLEPFKVRQSFTSRTFWSQVPYPPVARRAVAVTLDTLGEIADLCRGKGVPLLLVALPYKEQVASYTLRGPDFDVEVPQRYLRKYAEAHGIPYLDVLPDLRHYVRSQGRSAYVAGEGHFNGAGHAVTGEAMAIWFRQVVGKLPPEAPAGGVREAGIPR